MHKATSVYDVYNLNGVYNEYNVYRVRRYAQCVHVSMVLAWLSLRTEDIRLFAQMHTTIL